MNSSLIYDSIQKAAIESGRDPSVVRLCAVIKRQPRERIQNFLEHFHFGGVPILGESYLQEFLEHQTWLPAPYESHFIGPMQSNKIKKVVGLFDVIQSVDSLKTAERTNKVALEKEISQRYYLQVNISGDGAKRGVHIDEVLHLVAGPLAALSHLRLEGLMTITRLYETAEHARKDYKRMAVLHKEVQALEVLQGVSRLELSMGMSSDYQVAIEEGATMVRLGSALFGDRPN